MKFARVLRVAILLKAILWLAVFSIAHVSESVHAQGVAPAVLDEIEGELEILHEDTPRGGRNSYFLKTGERRLSLNFAKDAPTDLTSGTQIRVRGVRTNNTLALQSDGGSVQVLSLPALNTLGEQRTLVILVNFQDKPTEQPWTVEQVRNLVFDTTSEFFRENSYQQTWLSGDIAGWYTIPFTSTICDVFAIANYAKEAATTAGYSLAAYSRYVYAFPQNACGGQGVGTIGGSPSEAWIIGSLDLKVLSHELGHNLGLYHSRALDCGQSVLGTNCSVFEYGDRIDTMGNVSAGHFNAYQKERLGWLDYGTSPFITTVQENGLFTIEPLETVGRGPKALAILKSTDAITGQQTWYYVEYRQAVGFDSFLDTNANVLNGIVVHTGSPSDGNSSYLLDMTPASASQNWSDWSDPALVAGRSFHDPTSGVTISTVSTSSVEAVVSVNFAAPACVHANPSLTISPKQSQGVVAGTAVTYTVSVTNNDPSNCLASSFALQTGLPSGWTGVFSSSTVTVNPATKAFITLKVTSPVAANRGTYNFSVSATNTAAATFAASTTATYVIKRK